MPDKAWTPSAQDVISVSTSKSSSSNLNFRIPWHKMSYSLLNTLNHKRWLTTYQKQAVVDFVIDDTL
ncbi:hypothetical protein JTE90_026790 [Oedothorax gibbosus]|uniref:Uncharacterized protein n=1 Tax=Oedothorax gibbosus TaxID=931172 RepID=A0AAV6US29_9ARAC|nr:hypothetical protein JTE90_026790 [Oedothorax gibbosus]